MKIKLWSFKKTFRKAFGRKQGELINPLKAWTAGLLTATGVFVVGAALTAVDFYLQLVSPAEIVIDEKPLVYREQEVRNYAELYNEKAQTFNELRASLRQATPPPLEESTEEVVAEEGVAEEVAEEAIDE